MDLKYGQKVVVPVGVFVGGGDDRTKVGETMVPGVVGLRYWMPMGYESERIIKVDESSPAVDKHGYFWAEVGDGERQPLRVLVHVSEAVAENPA